MGRIFQHKYNTEFEVLQDPAGFEPVVSSANIGVERGRHVYMQKCLQNCEVGRQLPCHAIFKQTIPQFNIIIIIIIAK